MMNKGLGQDARNTWHKIDHTKPSQFRVENEGERLTISRLNKYDLENFECRSESYEEGGGSGEQAHVATKRLELNADEYTRELAHFYATSRRLEIFVVPELSDLRLGGKVTLKCTNEGSIPYIFCLFVCSCCKILIIISKLIIFNSF